jgi:hypothetical protein
VIWPAATLSGQHSRPIICLSSSYRTRIMHPISIRQHTPARLHFPKRTSHMRVDLKPHHKLYLVLRCRRCLVLQQAL